MLLLFIVLLLVLLLFLLWLAGFLLATDFAVPTTQDASQYRRVLAIFPHADDETISCGGFLRRMSASGSAVTLTILTKGEKGGPRALHGERLKAIRTREARAVATILGISRLIQEDFGDSELHKKKQELTAYIATLIEQEQPDLLITYDLAGFYGHQDHIACAEIITQLQQERFPAIPLWYVTFPQKLLARINLPEDMSSDPAFAEKRAFPTRKVFIGAAVFPKMRAWYTYKSQRAALAKGISPFVPAWFVWFLLSLVLFEYFAEAGGITEKKDK